jgi:hypothetical protein
METAMLVAFLLGLATGLFFTPIALVPFGAVFLVIAVCTWAYGGDLDSAKILISVGFIAVLNVGFLAGALVKRVYRNFRNRQALAL